MRILPQNRVMRVTAIALLVAAALVLGREVWLFMNGTLTVVEDKNLVVTEPLMAGLIKPNPAFEGGYFNLDHVPEFDICGVVRSPSGDRFMLGMRGMHFHTVVIEVKRTMMGAYASAWYVQFTCAAPNVFEQAKRGSVTLSQIAGGSFPVHVKAEFETKLGVVRCQFVTRHQVSFEETLEHRKREEKEGGSCRENPWTRAIEGEIILAGRGCKEPVFNYAMGLTNVLTWAASDGRVDEVKGIITKGVDVNACGDGTTPLISACQRGQTNMVQFLIENGADVNRRNTNSPPRRQMTPLAAATKEGHQGIADMLRKAGARE